MRSTSLLEFKNVNLASPIAVVSGPSLATDHPSSVTIIAPLVKILIVVAAVKIPIVMAVVAVAIVTTTGIKQAAQRRAARKHEIQDRMRFAGFTLLKARSECSQINGEFTIV
jgi:hypothetical protein